MGWMAWQSEKIYVLFKYYNLYYVGNRLNVGWEVCLVLGVKTISIIQTLDMFVTIITRDLNIMLLVDILYH